MPEPRAISLRAKLSAFVIALLVAFGLAEFGARMFYPAPPALGREPQLRYQSDPELGFIHVSNQAGYLDDGLATISDLGLRGNRPQTPKPAEHVRILAVGDSTTFGWGVNDDETYTEQLAARLRGALPNVDVVNAGVVSYDLEQSTRLLKRLLPVIEPDLVLVGVLWNDLPYETVSPTGEPQPGRPSSPRVASSRGQQSGPQIFRMANQPTGFAALVRRSRLAFAIRHAWLAALAPTQAASNQVQWEQALLTGLRTAAIDSAWDALGASLTEIQALSDQHGFAVGVVIMPIRAQVEQSYPDAAYQSRLRELAQARGFFVVDPLEKFVSTSNRGRLFIPYDRMHLTAAGNGLVADAAYEVLRTRPELRFRPVQTGERK